MTSFCLIFIKANGSANEYLMENFCQLYPCDEIMHDRNSHKHGKYEQHQIFICLFILNIDILHFQTPGPSLGC